VYDYTTKGPSDRWLITGNEHRTLQQLAEIRTEISTSLIPKPATAKYCNRFDIIHIIK
jgi:hypothetical protein